MSEISHSLWLTSSLGPGLHEGDARELFLLSRREHYQAGERIFQEGEEASAFFLIAKGDVALVMKGSDGSSMLLAKLGPGSVLGEMSLLTREKRSATAIVQQDAIVLRVSWKDFEELSAQNPQTAFRLLHAIARVLASRLKNVNIRLTDMTARNLNNAPHEQIEEFQSFQKSLFSDWSF